MTMMQNLILEINSINIDRYTLRQNWAEWQLCNFITPVYPAAVLRAAPGQSEPLRQPSLAGTCKNFDWARTALSDKFTYYTINLVQYILADSVSVFKKIASHVTSHVKSIFVFAPSYSSV